MDGKKEQPISKGKVIKVSDPYQKEDDDRDIYYVDIAIKYLGEKKHVTQGFYDTRGNKYSKNRAEDSYEVGDDYILTQWQINNYFED